MAAVEPSRSVVLLKPPHEQVRIEWSAAVHENGGEFLLSRGRLDGSSAIVARVPSASRRYRIADPAGGGMWVYRLLYRDRGGRDHLLATIHLNVDELEPGRSSPAAGSSLHFWPDAAPHLPDEIVLRVAATRAVELEDDVPLGSRPRPPTPPPRGRNRPLA